MSGVPAADVEDVTQNALLSLVRALPEFVYDRSRGRFSGFLRRTLRSKIADYWKQQRRRPPHVSLLEDADLAQPGDADNACDIEYRHYLLETCLARVRPAIDDVTWRVFMLYVRERIPAKEVAAQVGISSQAVAGRAWRVMEKLRTCALEIAPNFWLDD